MRLNQMKGTAHEDALAEKHQAQRDRIGELKSELKSSKDAYRAALKADDDKAAGSAQESIEAAQKELKRAQDTKQELERARAEAKRDDWAEVYNELLPQVRQALADDAEAVEGVRKAAVTLQNRLNKALETTSGNHVHSLMNKLAEAADKAAIRVPDDIAREDVGRADWFGFLKGQNSVGKLKSDSISPTADFKKHARQAAQRAEQIEQGEEPDGQ